MTALEMFNQVRLAQQDADDSLARATQAQIARATQSQPPARETRSRTLSERQKLKQKAVGKRVKPKRVNRVEVSLDVL